MGESINNTTKTVAGEKRKRLAQACLVCRKKKTKCDGIKPVCGNCNRLNQQCSYAPSNRKRGSRQVHIEVLEQRLAKMESLLKNNNISTQSKNNDNNNSSRNKLNIHYHNNNSNNSDNYNNKYIINYGSIPTIDSSPSSSISKDMKLLPQLHFGQCLSLDKNHHKVIDMDRSLLPDKEVMNELIQLYLERVYGCSPFFYRQELDYNNTPNVILMAITAATAKFSPKFIEKDRPLWLSGESYAQQIRRRMDEIIDMPSIEHIQVLLLMIMHEFGCARGARSWMYCGIAGRMALELGLHKEPTERLKPGDTLTINEWQGYERRRNVFWGLYVFETFGSASCARSVYFKDKDIDCHLPTDDDCLAKGTFYTESLNGMELIKYMVSERNEDGTPKSITYVETVKQDPITRSRCAQGWPTHLLRITSLYGTVASFVNRDMVKSTTPLSPYDMETNDFVSLNQKLELWYSQLPLLMRNTPANLERYRKDNSRDLQRFLLSHILYNSLIIFLNRPAFKLINTVNNMDNVPTHVSEAIHLGVEKCLAASDNVGVMLTDINMNIQRTFPFLSYLTYSTATVVVHTLFTGTSSEAKKAAESLKTHFQFLQNMRKYYATADKLFFMIRNFFTVNKNQLKTRGVDRTLQIGNETVGRDDDDDEEKEEKEDIDDVNNDEDNAKNEDPSHQRHHNQNLMVKPNTTNNNNNDSRYQPMHSPSTSSISSIATSSSNQHQQHHHQLTLDELVGSIDNQFNYLLEQQISNNIHIPNITYNNSHLPNNNNDSINTSNLYNNSENLQWQQNSNYYLTNGVLPISTSTEQDLFNDWPFTF
ncbi:fungal-specific transcription factor domain-containing protein [Cunninghamella echinulata]|nr:fungal-specific transcription factor domain-containing protein [Cunninghamella echinulata]